MDNFTNFRIINLNEFQELFSDIYVNQHDEQPLKVQVLPDWIGIIMFCLTSLIMLKCLLAPIINCINHRRYKQPQMIEEIKDDEEIQLEIDNKQDNNVQIQLNNLSSQLNDVVGFISVLQQHHQREHTEAPIINNEPTQNIII